MVANTSHWQLKLQVVCNDKIIFFWLWQISRECSIFHLAFMNPISPTVIANIDSLFWTHLALLKRSEKVWKFIHEAVFNGKKKKVYYLATFCPQPKLPR